MINYRMDIDRPLSFTELDNNFRGLETTNLETQTILADQILSAANMDGKIDKVEQDQLSRVLEIEVQIATAQEAQIIANAKADGIITQFEQSQIDAATDITTAYKEYQNIILKAMNDGVLTVEEEALITLSRAYIDASNNRFANIGTDILAASTEASSASIAAANADGKIDAVEQATIEKILAEEQKRIVAITERIESEASLDGKITAAEQATIDAANQLEEDYIEYNRIVTLALADGVLTPEEEALIATALANIKASKQKVIDLQASVVSLSTNISQHAIDLALLDGKITDEELKSIADKLALETVMAQDKADRIRDLALLDGKVDQVEQNAIDLSADVETAYKEYSRVTMIALADGVLTAEERAMMSNQQAYIQATIDRTTSIETAIVGLNEISTNLQTGVDDLGTLVSTEKSDRIQALADEASARAVDVALRVAQEALLDGKITVAEQNRIDTANQLTTDYKNYANILQKSLADDVLTDDERALIADAQAAINATKNKFTNINLELSASNLKIAEQEALSAVLDGKITQEEEDRVAAILAEQTARVASLADTERSLATLDGKIDDQEQARISALDDLEVSYKEHSALVMKYMADGVLTDEELALIALSKASIDATKARLDNIDTLIDTSNKSINNNIAALSQTISDEETSRIQSIADEAATRADDMAIRILAEASLDGKITQAEQATIDKANQLTIDYKMYSNIIQKSLADGILTEDEKLLIADAENDILTTKTRMGTLEGAVNALSSTDTNLIADIEALLDNVDADNVDLINAIANEQNARASDIALRIAAEASLDGKITDAEQVSIENSIQLTIDYKNYSNIIQKSLADGILTDDERLLIANAQAAVDATKSRMVNIESSVDSNFTSLTDSIVATNQLVSDEEAARIQALADEATARASDIADRVTAEANLDYKISDTENKRIALATQLETDYKTYANILQKSLSDGVLTPEETTLIADAQAAIDATKARMDTIETTIADNTTLIGTEISNITTNFDGKLDTEKAARIQELADSQAAQAQKNTDLFADQAALDGKIDHNESLRLSANAQLVIDYKNYSNVLQKSMSDGVLTSDEVQLISDAQASIDATKSRLVTIENSISQLTTDGASTALLVAAVDGKVDAEETKRIEDILALENARIQEYNDRIADVARIDGKITDIEAERLALSDTLEADYKAYSQTLVKAISDGVLTPEEEILIADAQAAVDLTKGKIADIDNQTKKTKKQVDFVKLAANSFNYTKYSNYGNSANLLLSSSKESTYAGQLTYFDEISNSELNMSSLKATFEGNNTTPILYVYDKNGLYFVIFNNSGKCFIEMYTKEFSEELNKYILIEKGSYQTIVSFDATVEFHESYISLFDGTSFEMVNYALTSYASIDIKQAFLDNSNITGADVSTIHMSMFGNFLTFSDFNQSLNFNIIDYTYGFTSDTIPFEASTVQKVLFKIDTTTTMYISSDFVALFKDGNFLNAISTKYKFNTNPFNGSVKDFYVYNDILYIVYDEAVVMYSTIDLVHFQTLPVESKINALFEYQNFLVAVDNNRIFKINNVDEIRSPEVSQYNPYAVDNYVPKFDQSLITKRFFEEGLSTIPKKTFLELLSSHDNIAPYFDIVYDEHVLKQKVYFLNKFICFIPYAYFYYESCFLHNDDLYIGGTYLSNPADLNNRENRYVIGKVSLLNNTYIEYQSFDKNNAYNDIITVINEFCYYRYIKYSADNENMYIGLLDTFNQRQTIGKQVNIGDIVNKHYLTVKIDAIVYLLYMYNSQQNVKIINFTNNDEININIASGTIMDFQIVENVLILETNVGQFQYNIDFTNATATEKTTNVVHPSFLNMFKTTDYIIEILINVDSKFLCNVYNMNYTLLDKLALNAEVFNITYHNNKFNLITEEYVYVWEFEKVLQYATTNDLAVLKDLNTATNSRMDDVEIRMDSIDNGGFQQQIDDEIATRMDDIGALTTSNDNAHNSMLTRITNVEDAIQNTDLGTEITDRANADTLLRNSIDNLDAQVLLTKDGTPLQALSIQVQTNTEDLVNLQVQSVDAERDARVDADTTLQQHIDQEVSARTTDVTALNDRITDIQTTSISAEETARIEADDSLGSRIDAEFAQRTSDVSNIDTRLDTLEASSSFTFFDDYSSTGIDKVLIGNIIIIKNNNNSKMEQLIKIANTNMTSSSTIQDFKNDSNLYKILDIELGLIDLGTF